MERESMWAATVGRAVASHPWRAVGAWMVAVIALSWFTVHAPQSLSPSGFSADTAASRALDRVRLAFPNRDFPVLFVVLHSPTARASEPGFAAEVSAWSADIGRRLVVPGATLQPPIASGDGHSAVIVVTTRNRPDQFTGLAAGLATASHPGPAEATLGGPAAVYQTFIRDSEADLAVSERISLPVALLLLLIIFGGLAAAGFPVLTGLATVAVALAALGIVARNHPVSVFALNVTSLVGLGLSIDYSLLVVNRFREELRRGDDVVEAVARTVGSAGVATLISGAIVMIGFGSLMLSRLNILWSIGLGGALVVLVAIISSLTLIPAILALLGRRIDRFALPFVDRWDGSRVWTGIAEHVMARPGRFIAGSLVFIGLLMVPVLHLNLGVVGAESLPPRDAARQAAQLLVTEFSAPMQSPILVVADVEGEPSLHRLHDAISEVTRSVTDGELSASRQEALFLVAQPSADNASDTRELLTRLRSMPKLAGVSHVALGGEGAAYDDFLKLLLADFPKIIGTVVALTLVLLALAFRSLALPLKAVAMNLLSVGGALGFLTFIFQDGHFARALDFEPVGFIDAIIPLIIFAALFGLSMDYEVFLLSRIREEWTRTGDNRAAVACGMARTGRIITSAAAIMVVVCLSLGLSRLTLDKAIGLTFAFAVLLDATVIRLLLVPALMRVLGRWNWWPSAAPLP